MSAAGAGDFLSYWQHEGAVLQRAGDYAWMAGLLPGRRVLEVGCGLGFGTEALLARGCQVLAMDALDDCLAATRQRVGASAAAWLAADMQTLDEVQRKAIEDFAPDTVVCWLMGAPAAVTGAQPGDGGRAVVAYRERVHRLVAELASRLASVRYLHLVDRTAIAWQAKDVGRDTLLRYHLERTLQGLPFIAARPDAVFRKLGEAVDGGRNRQSHPGLKGLVPTLASLLAQRS